MANGETATNEKVSLVLHKPPPRNPYQQRNLRLVSNPTVLVHDSVWLLTNPLHKPWIPSTQPKSIDVSLESQAFWRMTGAQCHGSTHRHWLWSWLQTRWTWLPCESSPNSIVIPFL